MSAPSAPPKSVLLVEDEPSVRLTLAANLELEGYEVTEADSAEQALQLLDRRSFEIVVSDVRMGGMNGVELFRRIQRARPEIPVVLMTAFTVEYFIQEAKREGIFTVLPKPVNFDYLAATIARALRHPVVLIVDDDTRAAESMAAACAEVGLRVRAVSDGPAALRSLASDQIDVVVADLVMPGMTGAELIKQVRVSYPEVAVIAVSGHTAADLLEQVAASAGVFACMRKPVAREDLIEVIANARGAPVAAP